MTINLSWCLNEGEEMKYCGECKRLSLTEEKQQRLGLNKEDHICNRYNKRIMNFSEHPLLPKLDKCLKHKWWMVWE